MNVLVIGGGGREHAIVWSLSKSKKVDKIYCIPGNAGISQLAQCVDISATDIYGICGYLSEKKDIDYIVVSPDDPLALGLVNILTEKGYKVFGPTKQAAMIESSKVFSKQLMKKYGIPTAEYQIFDNYNDAAQYISTAKFPLVVKADGLALGKGVYICQKIDEAQNAVKEMIEGGKFGSSGSRVVIEEYLVGFEVSVLAFTDGKTLIPMPSSQDHKRAYDGDLGANTGGMGAFSPSLKYTPDMQKYAYEHIFMPTINALNREGKIFKGVIYFGLMINGNQIKVLEYNARFGDPETQSLLPRLKTDLLDIFLAVTEGKLDKINIEWEDNTAICVVMASKGYPEKYEKGISITIGKTDSDVIVFHAGTKFVDGNLVTNGGRILGITSIAKDIETARELAYKNIEKIHFEGAHYRKDIGIK